MTPAQLGWNTGAAQSILGTSGRKRETRSKTGGVTLGRQPAACLKRERETPVSRRRVDTRLLTAQRALAQERETNTSVIYCTVMYLISSMLGLSGMETI